jgi:hypothetical protein
MMVCFGSLSQLQTNLLCEFISQKVKLKRNCLHTLNMSDACCLFLYNRDIFRSINELQKAIFTSENKLVNSLLLTLRHSNSSEIVRMLCM